MAIATVIGLGIGAVGGISAGNFFFPGKIPQKDLSPFSLEADDDDSVPLPSAPKDGTVQGKPRNFLPFAPSWAKHPDYDRVLWMNTVLRTMWPYYNYAVGQQVLEQANPIIAEQIKQYPFIQAVDIEVIDLGTKPPAVGGAKTYSATSDEALLEAPIMWGSDMRVRVAVRIKVASYVLYIPLEVSDVQVRADIRVTLAPLVDTLPCIGAVTMTLLGEPYIDLSLRFLGCLDLMQLPGIKEAVHVIANKVIGDMLVYPNRMSFDIMPNGGKPPEPVGLLVVKVKKVTDIRGGGDLFSKVDAFVEVSVRDGRSLSTKTVWDDKNPEFDEVLTFIVDDPKTQSIKAFLKEHDIAFQKTLGIAEVPLLDADFIAQPRKIASLELPFFRPHAHGHLMKLAKVGAKASGTEKDATAKTMPGTAKEDDKKAENAENAEAKADHDLHTQIKKDPERAKKIIAGHLLMDVQFCPFKAAGESAGQDAKHKHTAKPQPQKKIMRRATTSLITPEHKGILTVTLISATNLTTPEEKGDVDPFVEFILYDPVTRDSQKQESSKLPNEPNPKWGEKFDFVMVSAPSILTVNVWDTLNWLEGRLSVKGLTGRKKTKQQIGTLRIPVAAAVRNGKLQDSWALQDTQKGDITLALSWTSVELEAGSDLKPDSAKDDDDDDEPTPPSGGYHNGKEE